MNSIMKKNTMKTNNNIIHIPQEQALAECFLSLLVSVPNCSIFRSASSVVLVNVYIKCDHYKIFGGKESYLVITTDDVLCY